MRLFFFSSRLKSAGLILYLVLRTFLRAGNVSKWMFFSATLASLIALVMSVL